MVNREAPTVYRSTHDTPINRDRMYRYNRKKDVETHPVAGPTNLLLAHFLIRASFICGGVYTVQDTIHPNVPDACLYKMRPHPHPLSLLMVYDVVFYKESGSCPATRVFPAERKQDKTKGGKHLRIFIYAILTLCFSSVQRFSSAHPRREML